MISEKCNSHSPLGKSLGWVFSDQSPSKVTSYLASSQAQQGSLIWSCFRCSSILASHSSKLNLPESMAHSSLFSTTVALKVTHPLPTGGAVHKTWIKGTRNKVCSDQRLFSWHLEVPESSNSNNKAKDEQNKSRGLLNWDSNSDAILFYFK